MKEIPSSDSSSESGDEGAKGLTACAVKLGAGASLYLQTTKTLMVMFFLLTILNLPVYYIYAKSTLNNDYYNLQKGFFKYFSVGNLGMADKFCGSGVVSDSNSFLASTSSSINI